MWTSTCPPHPTSENWHGRTRSRNSAQGSATLATRRSKGAPTHMRALVPWATCAGRGGAWCELSPPHGLPRWAVLPPAAAAAAAGHRPPPQLQDWPWPPGPAHTPSSRNGARKRASGPGLGPPILLLETRRQRQVRGASLHPHRSSGINPLLPAGTPGHGDTVTAGDRDGRGRTQRQRGPWWKPGLGNAAAVALPSLCPRRVVGKTFR